MKSHLLIAGLITVLSVVSCSESDKTSATDHPAINLSVGDFNVSIDTSTLLLEANSYLLQAPQPLTNFRSERSAGGPNDFYSEGDYWWPDPVSPDSPYVRRDGQTNPENFVAHRIAMRDLSRWVAALVAAYKLTGEEQYAEHALAHLNAFFLDPATRMNPNLLYAQAIKGRFTGRGIGIIDTIHLIEVAKSIQTLIDLGYLPTPQKEGLKTWFNDYATWMSTHPYGIDERDHGNNHSTWWATQLAAFAKLAKREDLLQLSRKRYKELLSAQMDEEGGFPEELGRTKPFSYSLFNLEGYTVLAEIASTPEDNLWTFEGPNGGLQKAWNFMIPGIESKGAWPYPPDIQHFDEIPIQSPGLLLSARAYNDKKLLMIWASLSPERKSNEVDRTFPLRQPYLWL